MRVAAALCLFCLTGLLMCTFGLDHVVYIVMIVGEYCLMVALDQWLRPCLSSRLIVSQYCHTVFRTPPHICCHFIPIYPLLPLFSFERHSYPLAITAGPLSNFIFKVQINIDCMSFCLFFFLNGGVFTRDHLWDYSYILHDCRIT